MVYAKDSIWMGKWYVRGKPVKRSLGPMRQPGSREDMTKTQAEAKLRDLISETSTAPPLVAEGMTVEQVGSRLITQLGAKNRKPSTVENYESYLRVHLAPHFGETPLSEITVDDVEDFIEQCLAEHSIKSTHNYLGLLHGIFDFGIRKRWAYENPCRLAEKPEPDGVDRDIRFLDAAELEALLEAASIRYRHNPETLQRAARVRTLRDVHKLPWKQVAATIGVAESTAIYLYRCRAGRGLERGRGHAACRARDVPHGGDDGSPSGRALRAAMDGHRLVGPKGPGAAQLRSRELRHAEVQALLTGHPARRPSGSGARAPVPRLGIPGGRGSRLRAPAHRGTARPLAGLEALQVRAEARRRARGQVSRPETYFRYALRCERRRDADDPGVDGSSRHQDDADLRRLRAGRERGRPHQRCLRRGDLRGD